MNYKRSFLKTLVKSSATKLGTFDLKIDLELESTHLSEFIVKCLFSQKIIIKLVAISNFYDSRPAGLKIKKNYLQIC